LKFGTDNYDGYYPMFTVYYKPKKPFNADPSPTDIAKLKVGGWFEDTKKMSLI
jgi:hypothetical protein